MNKTASSILGLFCVIVLSAYAVIFPSDDVVVKMLELSGIMIYFVFTLSYLLAEKEVKYE